MLGTLTNSPSAPPTSRPALPARRKGAQPGNTNARRHGFYASRDPHPALGHFSHIASLQQSAVFAARAGQLDMAEMYVQGLQELLVENFLAADLSRLTLQTFIQLERFHRTVSATLRAKRALKQLLDEQSFLPDLARKALPLAIAEFTDRRISPYAFYTANCHCEEPRSGDVAIPSFSSLHPDEPTNEVFVPHLLQKNRAITCSNTPSPFQGDREACRRRWGEGESSSSSAPASSDPCLTIDGQANELFVLAQPRLSAGASIAKRIPVRTPSKASALHLLQKNRAITCSETPSPFQGEGRGEGESSSSSAPASSDPSSPLEPPAGSLWNATVNCQPPTAHWFSLTTSQWSLLNPLLTSLRTQLADMGIRPRKRPFPDRFLLECILTRLAFGYSWDDLRPYAPVRACQVLYKQLCTSGRMRQIYEILHAHLESSGEVDLLTMSMDGTFIHAGDNIFLSPGQPPSWEQLTGLLLLQRALYNRRRIRRAETNERHRRGRYQREPSLSRRSSSRRKTAASRSTRRPAAPFPPGPPSSLISILDCRATNPLLASKLNSIQSGSP